MNYIHWFSTLLLYHKIYQILNKKAFKKTMFTYIMKIYSYMNEQGGVFVGKEKIYKLTVKGDNTLKTFFDRFYILPKEGKEWGNSEKTFLEQNKLVLSNEKVANGKNGYIVFTREKLLTPEDVAVIKNDTGTQREKAKKYGLSVGTINKIMNDKY